MSVRVLLVDDHQLVRAGLEQLLGSAEDVDVVGAAADGPEAVELVRRLRPDVVLMDLVMPVMDGVEATRRIRGECEQSQVVVLTSFSDRDRIIDAIDAGASERTGKAHLTSALQRIGVTDRVQAALWAERNGLGQRSPARRGQRGSRR